MKKLFTLLCAWTLCMSATRSSAQFEEEYSYEYSPMTYEEFIISVYEFNDQVNEIVNLLETSIETQIAAKKSGYEYDQAELNLIIDYYECLYHFKTELVYILEDLELFPTLFDEDEFLLYQEDFEHRLEGLVHHATCEQLPSQ